MMYDGGMKSDQPHFRPTVSEGYAEKIRKWQDNVYQELKSLDTQVVDFLGRRFVIPPTVHPINPMSDLIGSSILAEVKESDRVLDMGTGCGVNAILAASKSTHVLATDINPIALDAASRNAEANGVADRITFVESDVFQHAPGEFDLIIFDPPFRWFAPRDIYEVSTTDENYRTLTTFFSEVNTHLSTHGRALLCFGSSGDLDYVYQLIESASLRREIVAERGLLKDVLHVTYYTFKLTR
jgi:release factor glutamine methyltransferase